MIFFKTISKIFNPSKFHLFYRDTKNILLFNVKIDTKEKFTVITPNNSEIPANMTDEFIRMLRVYLEKDISHLVLNMKNIQSINEETCKKIAVTQQEFYEKNNSFVICELQKDIKRNLEMQGLLNVMNITVTESEAWDIIQMEEIERELLE